MNFIDQFKAMRRVSTSLVAVRTPDPATSIKTMRSVLTESPHLMWDSVRGLVGLNDAGAAAANLIFTDGLDASISPVETLIRSARLPKNSVLFFLNAQLYIKDAPVIQAIWNLRDLFKVDYRMLCMVSNNMTLPAELLQDVMLLDEPFPDAKLIGEIIADTYAGVEDLPKPSKEVILKATAALQGLAPYTAEQVAAMCITSTGLDVDQCWERKYTVIDETDSLSVWRKKETFADVEGVENAKDFLRGIFHGNDRPDLAIFMDEIEKMLAGAQGDLSGVSQSQHGALLKWMQDKNVDGLMFVGHPGAAKTALAHACGGEFGVPVIEFNIDAAQNSLIGKTGENTRNALKTIDAMGKPLVIATCNQLSALSPELKRRFQLCTFFFDLPTQKERMAIWKLYLGKYGITSNQPLPDDEGWTGAEIRTCCMLAYRLKRPLVEVAVNIVPVSRANAEKVEALRKQADGKWISASRPGVYRVNQQPEAVPARRAIKVG